MQEETAKKKVTVGDIVAENAQLKADITTFIKVVGGAFQSMGINMDDMSGDIMSNMAKILPKLTMQLTTGGGNNDAMARLNELTPIIERYKYLTE